MTVLSGIVSALFVLLICGTVLVILGSNDDSGKKIAWILVIAVVPVVGLVLYIVFGLDTRRPGQYAKKHRVFLETFRKNAGADVRGRLSDRSAEEKIREDYRPLARLLSAGSGLVASDGNTIEIITSGRRKLDALMEDISRAQHHVHMEYFYFRKDDGSRQIKELLMRKAREGVEVRFIHENIANIDISPRYYNEMKKAGVEVVRFTSPGLGFSASLNHRDHRKIVLIDGKIGYTGGMNIGDDYFIRWRDTHIRITGNAVAGLQYSFMNSFITSGGKAPEDFSPYFPSGGESGKGDDCLVQIVPDEPDSQWPVLHMGAVWAVQHATGYIYIQTPYFVPPEPLLLALKAAALRGADVRIMMPEKADLFYMSPANRSYYKECLEAGIRIYEKTGRFIHAKMLVMDDYLSIVGSANMDNRSLELNYEINSYIYDEGKAKVNREIFMKDLASCREIRLEQWKRRPWHQKAVQSLARLFSPLL